MNILRRINRRQPVYNFNVPIAKFAYQEAINLFPDEKEFKILDMCMGWSARMVAAMSLTNNSAVNDRHICYYGTDPNSAVHVRFEQLKNFWNFYVCPIDENFQLYKSLLPAEQLLEDPVFAEMDGQFHVMLTSPPYFNKEVYSADAGQSCNTYDSYRSWSRGFLKRMVVNTYRLLKPGGLMFLNIADIKHTETSEKGKFHPLELDALNYAKTAGFELLRTYKYVSNIMQGMARGEINTKKPKSRHEIEINGKYYKYEPIFCFRKVR